MRWRIEEEKVNRGRRDEEREREREISGGGGGRQEETGILMIVVYLMTHSPRYRAEVTSSSRYCLDHFHKAHSQGEKT